jgi:hypothetical protein
MWSRVGLIAAAGFAVGVLWPRLAGVDIGPRAPEDARIEAAAAAAGPLPSASASAAAATSAGPAAPPAPAPAEPPKNKQIVVVGPGAIQRCWDDKDKKVEDCGELQLDPVAKKRLESLATCSAALGLEGKVNVVFDLDFKKKEVHVARAKKNSLPSSTVDGIVQCAAKELMKLDLGEVPHAFRRYTVSYALTFYPPGKEPQEAEVVAEPTPDAGAAGATTNETAASGAATVSWDTALLRKQPKDGDVVSRIVRGTRVKIVAKQNDWYRVESAGKTGWVYRGAIGL